MLTIYAPKVVSLTACVSVSARSVSLRWSGGREKRWGWRAVRAELQQEDGQQSDQEDHKQYNRNYNHFLFMIQDH